MIDEGFEEWDADFLDQLIQVEELALSSANPTQQHHHHPPHPPLHLPAPATYDEVSYSPPRELSQRVQDQTTKGLSRSSNGSQQGAFGSIPSLHRSHNGKEQETAILKRELGRVSKQLTRLEQECLELRRERDKKEEQLQSVLSRSEAKNLEVKCTKSKNLDYGVHHIQDPISTGCQNVNFSGDPFGSWINLGVTGCKAIGVQTDEAGECTPESIKRNLFTDHCSNDLRAIWDASSGPSFGKDLVTTLLVACEADFQVLFGCLSLNLPSIAKMDSLAAECSSHMALQDYMRPAHSAEGAKVTHLYSMLTKLSSGMVKLEALLKALIDLCVLDNDIIVYRSLRVLHMVLSQSFSLEQKTGTRDNVVVEEQSLNHTTDSYSGSAGFGHLFFANINETYNSGHSAFETRSSNPENLGKNAFWKNALAVSLSDVDWVYLFELMHQIAWKNNKEHLRFEAVSIMNIILLRSNAYLERERYGRVLVLPSVSQLLKKESGLRVQTQAVHLLYLLLNCPKFLIMFCSGYKEESESAAGSSDAKNASAYKGFSAILDGLADCVTCSGNNVQELKLKRNAIIMLAFLASSGRSGFEILLGLRLPKRANLIGLILRVLVWEMDKEESEPAQPPPEIFKERCLLIREALIFLNRLVSNPQYSTAILRALTNSRDVASLTIDIANRLSRKGLWLSHSDDCITRQMRESEIVELARVFKKRVFTFLGDRIS